MTGFILLAVGLNAGAAVLSWWRRAVTAGGAVAGLIIGSTILIAGGFFYWTMLMIFFVTASVVSRVGKSKKEDLVALHAKGDQRDWIQVLANGGVACAAVLLVGVTRQSAFGVAAAAAFASANSDTWASELGVLSARPPRSVVTWRELPRGTSGGVTVVGTLSSAAGAAIVAIWFGAADGFVAGLVVLAAGTFGSLVDSLLGATVQAQYETADGERTERARINGVQNKLVRGAAFLNNDAVNFLSSAIAAAAAGVVATLL